MCACQVAQFFTPWKPSPMFAVPPCFCMEVTASFFAASKCWWGEYGILRGGAWDSFRKHC